MVWVEPFIFVLVPLRFCMLCSVVLLDLLCNYVAFRPFQVVLVVLVFKMFRSFGLLNVVQVALGCL